MKLTYFTEQTLPKGTFAGKSKAPRINLGKNGAVRLNAAASEMLKIKEGDRISIAQDQDEPENWYLFKDKEHGFELRMMSDKKSYGFNHSSFISMFKDAMSVNVEGGISYNLAQVPTTMKGDKTEYWGILIK